MKLSSLIQIGFFLLFIVGPILRSLNKKAPKPGQKPNQKPTLGKNPSVRRTIVSNANDDFNARLEEARKRVQEAMEAKESGPVHSQSHSQSQHAGTETEDELFHGRSESKHIEMPKGLSQPISTSKHQNLPKGIGGRLRVPKTLTGQTVVSHQNLPTGLSGHLSQANHQALSEGLTGHMSNKYNRPEFEVGLDRLEQHHSQHVKFKQHTRADAFAKKTKNTVKLNDSVIKTDATSIVNGIIWHQILSEPKYKKF